MQHVWEFFIKLRGEETPLILNYVTQSGRKTKVAKKILQDLEQTRGIGSNQVERFFLEKKR